MDKTTSYEVTSPIRFQGVNYGVGALIEMTGEEAGQFAPCIKLPGKAPVATVDTVDHKVIDALNRELDSAREQLDTLSGKNEALRQENTRVNQENQALAGEVETLKGEIQALKAAQLPAESPASPGEPGAPGTPALSAEKPGKKK